MIRYRVLKGKDTEEEKENGNEVSLEDAWLFTPTERYTDTSL